MLLVTMFRLCPLVGDLVDLWQHPTSNHSNHEKLGHQTSSRRSTNCFDSFEVLRPHVANGGDAGEDIVLTYCGLSNLGIAYTPSLGGKPLDLHPMTQLENNLATWSSAGPRT